MAAPSFQAVSSNLAKNPVKYAAGFDLDEKEIAFLLETKPTTKKVKTIFQGAQEQREKEFALKRKPLQVLGEKELNAIENPEEAEENKSFAEPNEKQVKFHHILYKEVEKI